MLQGSIERLETSSSAMQGSIERLEAGSSATQGSVKTLHDDVQDTLEAIHGLSSYVDERFSMNDDKFTKIDNRLNSLEGFVRTQMVTKSYLDDKLASKLGDYLAIDKKQEVKINTLVYKLEEKKILSNREATELIRTSPFPVSPTV